MKVAFSEPLIIQEVLDSDDWLVLNPSYKVSWPDGEVDIPYRFRTDFASVPKMFHNIISPLEHDIRSIAVAHDRLYGTHDMSRADADNLLYWGMISLGAGQLKSWKAYLAVRSFGSVPYNSGPTRLASRRMSKAIMALDHPQLGEIVTLQN